VSPYTKPTPVQRNPIPIIGSTTDCIIQHLKWVEEDRKKDELLDTLETVEGRTLSAHV